MLFILRSVHQPGHRNINPCEPPTPWHLILFGNESLHYWFWLRLYICLQFVLHCSPSEAHYIKPTINLEAFALSKCTKVGGWQLVLFLFCKSLHCFIVHTLLSKFLKLPVGIKRFGLKSLGSFLEQWPQSWRRLNFPSFLAWIFEDHLAKIMMGQFNSSTSSPPLSNRTFIVNTASRRHFWSRPKPSIRPSHKMQPREDFFSFYLLPPLWTNDSRREKKRRARDLIIDASLGFGFTIQSGSALCNKQREGSLSGIKQHDINLFFSMQPDEFDQRELKPEHLIHVVPNAGAPQPRRRFNLKEPVQSLPAPILFCFFGQTAGWFLPICFRCSA